MNIIDELTEYFRKFPGVGPRQAKRFVYYLLRNNPQVANSLSAKISSLHNEVKTCSNCFQYFITQNPQATNCQICSNKNRDKNSLLIVANDVDLKTIERSGTYNGLYFVLGGTVPITSTDPQNNIRLSELTSKIHKESSKLEEVILALSANPEGEKTADIIRDSIKQIVDENNIKISVLGRGLSTGTEIEYSDAETLKNALNNRI
jgi:recombination protein RecR